MIHLLKTFALIAASFISLAITGFVVSCIAGESKDAEEASWVAMGIVGFVELLIVCSAQGS